MTAEEETAFHRGKQAALIDARPHQQSERIHCTYRRADLRRAWRKGYEEQAATRTQPFTAEQEANLAGFKQAIDAWLERTK